MLLFYFVLGYFWESMGTTFLGFGVEGVLCVRLFLLAPQTARRGQECCALHKSGPPCFNVGLCCAMQ